MGRVVWRPVYNRVSLADYKRACKGQPLHFICRKCFTPVLQSTALQEPSLVNSDVDAEMTDVPDVHSSVNSDVDAEMTDVPDVHSSENSDAEMSELSDVVRDTSVRLSLPFEQPSIYEEASLLYPPVPRDHVKDEAVTFTLITGGSQKGKDLLMDTHGYSYVVKIQWASQEMQYLLQDGGSKENRRKSSESG
ncbi:hypothetical protein DPMN_063011 [Dreissena polymorpha]|uniref:Uncharacterized protein n=1 Tax=Dreissena polymorpha TaxID=45954 RepID=A0A9D4CAU3_DREPO|nr:hypothetical protein DPMN_063011 [Dreissena polymorpha]